MVKLDDIHFSTVELLWDGLEKRAFNASYFYISLEIGKEKFFNKYPELQLAFSDKNFSNASTWKQVGEACKQWENF